MTYRFLVVCLLLFRTLPAQSAPPFIGMPLEEALRSLQVKGLKIIYSDSLVQPGMTIAAEPRSKDGAALVKELIQPFQLDVRRGPSGTLMIVRAKLPKQDKATPPKTPAFQSPQEYVVVPFATVTVSAQDEDGNFVTNLSAEDFVLRENGLRQKIVEFTNSATISSEARLNPGLQRGLLVRPEWTDLEESREGVSYILLLDSSASMNKPFDGHRLRIDMVRELARSIVEQMLPEDSVTILEFNQDFRVLKTASSLKSELLPALGAYSAVAARTALYDAILSALEIGRDLPGRRALILCSDGEDNLSHVTLKDLKPALQASGITVFGVATVPRDGTTPAGRRVLEEISRITGGHTFYPSSGSEPMAHQVSHAINSQYRLGYYVPFSQNRGWRSVEITCKVQGIKLTYRSAYIF